ncbi:MAG: EamA family transporter [Desulfuromonadaceae bacterium]|nr:EamA family transporter [Desulfuromonadaceae bacterium]MDD5104217.1 EamA family transporter [Desulfuromonadaceae bacterium]
MHSTINTRAEARNGLLRIMIAAVMWGTVGITTKTLYGLSATNPLSIGFFRLALSLPVLLAVCWATQKRRMFIVARQDLLLMLLIGMMTALYQVCYFSAVERTGVAVATVVTLCTAPVMVAVISVFISKQRPSAYVLMALTGALAGTALLVGFQENAGGSSADTGGILLASGSALGYAIVTLASRKLAGRYHPFQSIAISFSFGAIILFVFAASQGLVMNYTPVGWSLLLYLGTFPTALAYVLFIAGMRATTATVASISTLMEPLVATVLAWLIFGERFSAMGFVGVALLSGALVVLYIGGTVTLSRIVRTG